MLKCSSQHCTFMYDSMYRCGKNSCPSTFSPATLPEVLRFFIWRTVTNNHSIAPWIIRHLFHTVSEIVCRDHHAHVSAKLGHYFKCVRYAEMRKRLVHLGHFAISHMGKVPLYNPQVLQNVISWGSVGLEKMVCEQNFMLWCWKLIEEGKAFCYMQWPGLVCYIKKGEYWLCAAALRHHP